MCGIVTILSRSGARPAPAEADLLGVLDAAVAAAAPQATDVRPTAALDAMTAHAQEVDRLLRGVPGVLALVDHPTLVAAIEARLDRLDAFVVAQDALIEAGDATSSDIEAANAALVRAKDVLWVIRHDRLRTAAAVGDLAGRDGAPAAVAAFYAVQLALSAIDRLEVRGRDSAGLHLFVWDHALDLDDPEVAARVSRRASDPLFASGSVRVLDGVLSFVYKAAAEIGELGDNTAGLRAAIKADPLLRLALAGPDTKVAVLGHTRWASVGIISEPNAHPVNSEEELVTGGPYVVAALNGDVDNHADLRVQADLCPPAPITTDAKVIPALVSRAAANGTSVLDAFRRTVSTFDGSVAIAAASAAAPGQVLLALRGSGQGLYVGLADDLTIVASEPYGLVEVTDRYFRMDGEAPAHPDQPLSRGQVVSLSLEHAGELDGIARLAYDGTSLPIGPDELVRAEITTRDIDRGDAPHFLLKEILEAPTSFGKTLRGRIVERDGHLSAALGERALPPALAERLRAGSIRRVLCIGQGTAAVASQAFASLLAHLAADDLRVDQMTATELSGFHLRPDMSDTLVVAVSQSGTTTDTNRTVDLARSRGATVIGIVNRRQSDLTDKADGVLYTSDGRDVEMSVASTKAFYSQVAAGALLACAVTAAAGCGSDQARHDVLTGLRELPHALSTVLALRPEIAEAARRFAPYRRYWAVVGNGPNTVAAEEIRIKLSELCYKSIACDVTEDKKHIDLSSEPLILVCAVGLIGSTADDVAKEVAIFRAHKAAPIVIATEGDERFRAAPVVLTVPRVEPRLAFVLAAMVGHLFGYEAALAIDALALPLREAREAIEHAVGSGAPESDALLVGLGEALAPIERRFLDGMRSGAYDGHLEASTAVRVVALLGDVSSDAPLEAYQRASGKIATPAVLLDDLTAALTAAIAELTRPVDAIKHQAKTVTVGISRSDEALLDRPLVRAVLEAGAPRERLGYATLRSLAALDPAVAAVSGFTRYRVEGDPAGTATIEIVDRRGVSLNVPSRVERDPHLVGTKRRVAMERELLVARGRRDGRTVLMVPEVKGSQCTGITLVHVRFADRLAAPVARAVLQGWDHRYDRLVDWVTETEGGFRDDLLAEIPVADLLTVPVSELAERWRVA
jgi:glucosamine--fructose-6-phosphate aminotransferase (isomerizing)